MNYSEIKKELKAVYADFLKPLGYKSDCDRQGCEFGLLDEQKVLRIGYGVVNYVDEFTTGGFIYLGILPIEKIQAKILNEEFLPAKCSTLWSSISHYRNELNFRFRIKNMEDLFKCGEEIKRFYLEYAIPFFSRYGSVTAIDVLLNNDPSNKVIYCDDLAWRIIKGLIAARLNRNPKYEQLRNYYFDEVQSKFQGYFMYDKCMKVIDFLDKHSVSELETIAR